MIMFFEKTALFLSIFNSVNRILKTNLVNNNNTPLNPAGPSKVLLLYDTNVAACKCEVSLYIDWSEPINTNRVVCNVDISRGDGQLNNCLMALAGQQNQGVRYLMIKAWYHLYQICSICYLKV